MWSSIKARGGAAVMAALLVAVIGLTAYLFYRYGTTTADLYDPHFIGVRVGDVPIFSADQPPVDVMDGLPVSVSCEMVPVQGADVASFRLSGYGEPKMARDCAWKIPFSRTAAVEHRLEMEYLVTSPGVPERVVDRKQFSVRVVPATTYFRIRSFETADEKQIPTLTVPPEVIPYVDAAMEIDLKPEDLSVLFFVQPLGMDRPILQISVPPDNPEAYSANIGPLKKYREWGGNVGGYAAWPGGYEPGTARRPPPIQVGNEEDVRQAFEVFAVLLKSSDVPALVDRCIRFTKVAGETPVFSLGDVTMETLRSAAYKGWITPPVTVVRAMTAPERATRAWSVESAQTGAR